jgi:hypothetical protein
MGIISQYLKLTTLILGFESSRIKLAHILLRVTSKFTSLKKVGRFKTKF